MTAPTSDSGTWPALSPLETWQPTFDTLHMWTQVVGKIRLACGPWLNHSWGAALYLTTRGLTTSPVAYQGRAFAIDLDFVDHALRLSTADGSAGNFDLEPMSVADFYRVTVSLLREHGIDVDIFTRPVEVQDAIPFEEDELHASYDRAAVHDFWLALVQSGRVLSDFRARFIGKASPVHFFWGAFDLAVTRFSGRLAPRHPGGAPNCADWVMEEAYSHELSSAGFWPGAGLGEAAFYAYAYPEPKGFRERAVAPGDAYFHHALGEFILPYEAVRTARDPDGTLLDFLQTTYEAAANPGGWDRSALECVPVRR